MKSKHKIIGFLKNNWRLLLLIVMIAAIITSILIYFDDSSLDQLKELQGHVNMEESMPPPPPCFLDLEGKDSSDFVKLNVAYKSKDLTFNIGEFTFDDVNYADRRCMELTEDAFEMTAFIEVGKSKSSFRIKSNVSPKTNNFKYDLVVIAMTPRGDTIGTYKSGTRSVPDFNNDNISTILITKRHETKTSEPSLIFVNNSKRVWASSF
jgi:hypothetical protein